MFTYPNADRSSIGTDLLEEQHFKVDKGFGLGFEKRSDLRPSSITPTVQKNQLWWGKAIERLGKASDFNYRFGDKGELFSLRRTNADPDKDVEARQVTQQGATYSRGGAEWEEQDATAEKDPR